jgi:hypothetical protein
MLRRAAWIWIMHSLAFLAGLVVSGVVAVGLWSVVPTEGQTAVLFGLALAVSIVAVGTGYGLYLTLVGLLLDVELGWGFYLLGPLVVLGVMTLVFAGVFWGLLTVGSGSLAGYALLFVLGGLFLMRRVGLSAETDE